MRALSEKTNRTNGETVTYHVPIMAAEVVRGLAIKPGGVYLDCTLGGGGHSREILKTDSTVRLIAIDKDRDAIEEGKKLIDEFGDRVRLVHGAYEDAERILAEAGADKLDGALMDLGISSHQVDVAERGFSYSADAPLDMRMDRDQDYSAYDLVNTESEEEIARLLRVYGEEPFARRIAAKIAEERAAEPIATTGRLAEIVGACVPVKLRVKQGHPAKRTFQAIRIAVNGELIGLGRTIESLVERIVPGGRIAVLTFHSLEDRIVKQTLKLLATDCICDKSLPVCVCRHRASVRLVTVKPYTASEEELKRNPRAASAKLRIAEKV